MGQPIDPEPDIDPVRADIDPLDEQLDDACLFGGEVLVPQRIEGFERLADVCLGQAIDVGPRGEGSLADYATSRRSAAPSC